MNTLPYVVAIKLSPDRYALLQERAGDLNITPEQLATLFVCAVIDDDAHAHAGEEAA